MEEANTALKKEGNKPFSEKEWSEFAQYLKEIAHAKKAYNPYTNYPVTSITKPVFGAAFSWTGATIGMLGGDVISNSTTALAPRYKITALVGSTLFVFGKASPTGIALFAPVVAGKLLNAYCKISLASALGVAMGLLGQGVGIAVGMPLDLTYKLIWKVCSVITNYYSHHPDAPMLTGLRIADGSMVMSGIVFELMEEDKIPTNCNQKSVEITDDGQVFIDGTAQEEEHLEDVIEVTSKEEVSASAMHLPPEVLDELKKKIDGRSVKLDQEATLEKLK